MPAAPHCEKRFQGAEEEVSVIVPKVLWFLGSLGVLSILGVCMLNRAQALEFRCKGVLHSI